MPSGIESKTDNSGSAISNGKAGEFPEAPDEP